MRPNLGGEGPTVGPSLCFAARNSKNMKVNQAMLAVTAAVLLGGCAVAPPAPRLPAGADIVLITVDTLRADRLGAYGHGAAQTPNIDRLAAEGKTFFQATTPFPRTTPALVSMFSGLWPQHHGSREVGQPPKKVWMLAQLLQAQGYFTVGISANGAAGRDQHLDRGFDLFLDYRDLDSGRAAHVTRRTIELLAEVPDGRPLFLWVHYIDPHYPYRPLPKWMPEGVEPCIELMERHQDTPGQVISNREGQSEAVLEECLRLYDAELTYTDFEVGRLLDAVDGAGRLAEGLVIFTSDHGDNQGEQGLYFQHGPNVHDASLLVPLIFRGPGIEPGADHEAVRLEDLPPTVLSLLGVPRDVWPAFDGEDFSPRLGAASARRPADRRVALAESGSSLMVESHNYLLSGRAHKFYCLNARQYALCGEPGQPPRLYDHVADPDLQNDISAQHPQVFERLSQAREVWPPELARERTARTPRFKLVERPLLQGGYRRYLYDLAADPGAEVDVLAKHPKVAGELGAALEAWAEDLPRQAVPERTDEQVEALRALGYIN